MNKENKHKRIRGAGLVKINNGYAFMQRLNVKPSANPEKPYGDYYVFPGGGLEGKESIEECVEREILEELGIKVKALRKLYERETNDGRMLEYVYLCEYISGEFGTGSGPEFSNDPKYKERGAYVPQIIEKSEIKNIRLLPIEFKEKLVEDLKNNKF